MVRAFALLIVFLVGCGPDLVRGAVPFLELARRQHPPPPSRTEGVVHFRGVTVAQAEVTVVRHDGLRVELVTDELGRFALEAPAREVAMVIARAGTLLGVVARPELDSIDVELRVPWKVTGTVRDADGSPVAGARVTGSWQAQTCMGPMRGAPMVETATDASGTYVVALASPYDWLAATVSDGRAALETVQLFGMPEWSRVELVLPVDSSRSVESPDWVYDSTAQLVDEGDYEPPVDPETRRIEITLRTLSENGSPVDGVGMGYGRRVSASDRLVMDYQWNDEVWAYLFRDSSPSVSIARRGFVSARPSFVPDRPEVSIGDVILHPARGLTVTVFDHQGSPITGCTLGTSDGNVMTDASGTAWVAVGFGEVQLSPRRCCVGEAVVVPADVETLSIQLGRDEESCSPLPTG